MKFSEGVHSHAGDQRTGIGALNPGKNSHDTKDRESFDQEVAT
jgi:hypothetical protein